MKIHFLGTAGYHPNNRRHTACIMIFQSGTILDAGTGIFRAAQVIESDTLDIFLSHAHLDHCIGLTYFLDILHDRPKLVTRVHGEPRKLAAIRRHLFSKHLFPVQPPFQWRELGDRPVKLKGRGKLASFPLRHPGGSLGFRLQWPHVSIAYVTDSAVGDAKANYLPSIRGVDLLIHECHFGDGWEELAAKTGHSCLSQVARLAKSAAVGAVVLVHLNPLDENDDRLDLKTARTIFPNIIIAHDGMVIKTK